MYRGHSEVQFTVMEGTFYPGCTLPLPSISSVSPVSATVTPGASDLPLNMVEDGRMENVFPFKQLASICVDFCL